MSTLNAVVRVSSAALGGWMLGGIALAVWRQEPERVEQMFSGTPTEMAVQGLFTGAALALSGEVR